MDKCEVQCSQCYILLCCGFASAGLSSCRLIYVAILGLYDVLAKFCGRSCSSFLVRCI